VKLDFIPLAVVAVAFLDLAVVLGLGARRLLARGSGLRTWATLCTR